MKKITVFGGGTGSYVVLTGLKKYEADLAAVVSMTDSGGSTGKLRDQLGVLPPGDVRQCLLALSEAPELWRKLFLYRFANGDLRGHNFGNIFLSALEKVASNYDDVIDTASYVLQVKGHVYPVTYSKTTLCVEYMNGEVVKGEGLIDSNFAEKTRIKTAYLDPKVYFNPRALKRIQETDLIVIGPGDVYTSIVPILLVNGVKEAIASSSASVVYIMNLMTKQGQTVNYTAKDHLDDITRYLGRKPDVLVINNGEVDVETLNWYAENEERVVYNDIDLQSFKGKVIVGDFVDRRPYVMEESDLVEKFVRSVLRHDGDKLAEVLYNLHT
ncbi:YvcK family protein [Candidatus Roizmanbacteria bacterium]|nr:YvcK family protein [Candidatus Roizmanbacteria bacterium]